MSIKSDKWIKRMSINNKMIEPFVESNIRNDVVSYGLSSYGYDIRVADEFKIFTNINNTVYYKRKCLCFSETCEKKHLQLPKLLRDKLYISHTIPYTFTIQYCQY